MASVYIETTIPSMETRSNANKVQHLAVLNGRLRLHVPVITTPLNLIPESA
jgi:hypothetical protein